MTTRFLARLLSLLVKRREEVITGKPEASNTFLIKRKTFHDRLKKKNRNCKKKKRPKVEFYTHVAVTTPQDRSSPCWILRYDERLFPGMRTASFLFLFLFFVLFCFLFFFNEPRASSSRNRFNSMLMRDSLSILLIKGNYKGSGLLSHLRS